MRGDAREPRSWRRSAERAQYWRRAAEGQRSGSGVGRGRRGGLPVGAANGSSDDAQLLVRLDPAGFVFWELGLGPVGLGVGGSIALDRDVTERLVYQPDDLVTPFTQLHRASLFPRASAKR